MDDGDFHKPLNHEQAVETLRRYILEHKGQPIEPIAIHLARYLRDWHEEHGLTGINWLSALAGGNLGCPDILIDLGEIVCEILEEDNE